ncbi:hypothetical protein [Actinospica robiniae]|uniref:hypothetical protein n=1 Tax=Actinospica robiniae TaxID=304901 RepID=UPI000419F1BE|nr:hypothetical protein [Actinospica robiniae]
MGGTGAAGEDEAGRAHRRLAVELNNATWDLLDGGLSERSALAEQERALYGAYASTYHWLQVGTVANHGRGEYLIATVGVTVGRLDVAAAHAARYAELVSSHADAFADWDRAFLAELLARVAARSGAADAESLRSAAVRLASAVVGDEDRRNCLARLEAGPWGAVG